ncbi:Uncharacterized protein APZ42_032245 [Daphnia magna]|uniref:RNA-directed DNA polymerase n=1 Tax=Daphnia magna TaxID=35525 RepID=A0A164M574_9CRUS|nr:Uncharacterized protein APZ42_032245 [Daphnia magna]
MEAVQQALATLTALVQQQQQAQQQQQQAQQQQQQAQQQQQQIQVKQGKVLQIALQAIQQNQTTVARPKKRMVNAALRGVAASWQWQPPAGTVDDWAGWSAAFRDTFRKRYTFIEWETMVKARQQMVGESAAQYALSKATLRQYCPHQMSEAGFVPYLIHGIRHHQFAMAAIIHTPEIPDKHSKTIESLVAQNATLAAQVSDLQKRMAFQRQAPPYHQPPPVRQVNWQDQRRPPGTLDDRQSLQLSRPKKQASPTTISTKQSTIEPASGKRASRVGGADPAIGTVEAPNCSIRPAVIEVDVDKIEEKVSALVDPGATVNVICRSLVCYLKIEETQSPPLRLADGTASKAPAGEIVLNLCWEEISEEVKFLVFEDPSHPIILGTNWIARVRVVVSLSEAGVMEAKRGGLKLSDLQKNAPKSETNDWLAAWMDNRVADALSRLPIWEPNLKTEQPSICSLRMTGYSSQEVAFGSRVIPRSRRSGVLYRKITNENGKKHQLVAPSILPREIIQSCHASATSGHFGVHKTLARITERFWWPNMSVDVRTYVSSCYFCQMHKRPPGGITGELQPIPIPKKPFSLMGIDHVGPFKLTIRGNRYILVAVDYFSKWVIAKPVPDTSAIFIRDFIHQEVICHHGYPDRIISDRGSALAFAYLEEELAHWNIRHSFASTQYHQSNGQVEKMNGTLVMALKAFVNTRHTDWDEKIVDAVIAINTAKQEATEATPFEVVYGRSAELSHE